MTLNLSTQQIGAWLARILSLAAVVISAVPATDVPVNVRPYLALVGGIILAVDRYVTDPTTGTPPPVPTPAPPAPLTSAPTPTPTNGGSLP